MGQTVRLQLLSLILLLTNSILCTAREIKDSLELNRAIVNSPAGMLKGRVSNVQVFMTDGSPSGLINTRIRGVNSIRGNNEPLWVVDGVLLATSGDEALQPFWQYGDNGFVSPLANLNWLNLYDIESIDVISNLSDAAVYGSRGANGVIVVTTKRTSKTGFKAEYISNVGIAWANRCSEYFHPAPAHNHQFAISSALGRTNFRLSGYYKEVYGNVSNVKDNYGGVRLSLDAKSNDIFWCGFSTSVSAGNPVSATGTTYYGAHSTMLGVREIPALNGQSTSVEGWLADYDDISEIFHVNGFLWAQVNISRFLNLKTSLSIDSHIVNRNLWYGNQTAFGNNVNGAAALSFSSLLNYTADVKLSWARYLKTYHHILFSADAQMSGDKRYFNNMNGVNFFHHELRAKGLSLMDCKPIIRTFNYSTTSPAITTTMGYDYKHMAGVSLSLRADKLQRFESSLSIFPSVQAFADFAPVVSNPKIQSLKIEGGYGEAGFRKLVPYHCMGMYTGGFFESVPDELAAYYDGYNTLHSKEFNVGLRFRGLNEKINMYIGAYNKTTIDRLSIYCSGELEGSNGIWVKAPLKEVSTQSSTISNAGLEIEISGELLHSDSFVWTTAITAAYNSNVIQTLDMDDVSGRSLDQAGTVVTRNQLGKSVSGLYGYKLDKDNQVVGEGFIGNTIPKALGSIISTVQAGLFSLEAQVDAVLGFNILNMNRMSASGEYFASQAFVEKGDYLRLGRIAAKLRIPLSKRITFIKSLDVSAEMSNVFTLTSYSGWNPDVNSFGFSNLSNGIDYGSYPMTRSIMIGIGIKF